MNLLEATKRWPTPEAAMNHLEKVRWSGRPICPYCKSEKTCVHASKDKKMPRWQCETCHKAFSATVGTIFHHTHLPLSTWFLAIVIMLNAKKNVSNAQLGRGLGLPYKTAWSLALRIREAMLTDPEQKRLFHGIVEMDETYVGGRPRKGNTGSSGGGTNKRGRAAGMFTYLGESYERMQLRTVEDLFAGRTFKTPSRVGILHKERQTVLPLSGSAKKRSHAPAK
jgi:transposase-like protein